MVRKDCAQIVSWTGTDGQNGLAHVFAAIARLLDSKEEAGSLYVGDLIVHLLRKAGGAIVPVLPQLLHAMVARMTTAKSDLFLEVCAPIPFLWIATLI
jgi:importin-9